MGRDVAYTRFRSTDQGIYQMRADGATPERILVPIDPEPGANTFVRDWGRDFVVFSTDSKSWPAILELWASHYRATESRSSICLACREQQRFPQTVVGSPTSRNDSGVGSGDSAIVSRSLTRSSTRFPPRVEPNHVGVVADGSSSTSILYRHLSPYQCRRMIRSKCRERPGYLPHRPLCTMWRPAGERFLFNVSSTALANPPPINLVLNWTTGLK